MHKILERQLKRLNFDIKSGISPEAFAELLKLVDRTYAQADQDRYLLERSLAISSKEMQELYDEEKRQTTHALLLSEGRYRSLFDYAHDAIYIVDAESRQIIDANAVASERLGYSHSELLELKIEELFPEELRSSLPETINELKRAGKLIIERVQQHRDGSLIPVEISVAYIEVGGKKLIQSMVRDITERKVAQERLLELASRDSLTQLVNRAVFNDRLIHAIHLAKRNEEQLAVLFIDLDNFKEVNDAFGHKMGDEILMRAARRLETNVRESDTVGRFGGDEFVILLEGLQSANDALLITQKILTNLSQGYKTDEAELFISASIGISLFPKDGSSADDLIQNADRAMYLTKRERKNGFEFFNKEMKTHALEKLEVSNKLRNALDNDEFVLHYQPQVDSKSGRVYCVEALIRWRQPDGRLSEPGEFLQIAEDSGLMLKIGEWVLESACRQMVSWLERGVAPDWISVNVSDREINRPDFVELLESILLRTQIPPERLELELTENIIFNDMDKTKMALSRTKELGVRLAIDDFGTGYSTLQYLAHFPFDTLKIDSHYAQHLLESSKDAAVISGIVMIAKNLGLNVVGEGIELQEQLNFYESLDCNNIQGWFFSKDLDGDSVEKLMREGGIARPQLKMDLAEEKN